MEKLTKSVINRIDVLEDLAYAYDNYKRAESELNKLNVSDETYIINHSIELKDLYMHKYKLISHLRLVMEEIVNMFAIKFSIFGKGEKSVEKDKLIYIYNSEKLQLQGQENYFSLECTIDNSKSRYVYQLGNKRLSFSIEETRDVAQVYPEVVTIDGGELTW